MGSPIFQASYFPKLSHVPCHFGKLVLYCTGHDGAINSVGWSHNKKWLVSASEDKTVRIWSVCNTEPALLLGSAFSTQQPEAYNLFMTSAIGDGIKLWDLRTLRCERRFEGHVNRCHPCGIAVSPCGRFIASGSEDKCAYIYEMHSSTFSHKLTGHTESVINVAFNPSSAQMDASETTIGAILTKKMKGLRDLWHMQAISYSLQRHSMQQ